MQECLDIYSTDGGEYDNKDPNATSGDPSAVLPRLQRTEPKVWCLMYESVFSVPRVSAP